MQPGVLHALSITSLSLVGALFVFRLAKTQRLSFRFTVGWLLLLCLAALSGVLIPLTEPIARKISTTPGVIISGLAIVILVLICIQLSVSISGLQKQIQVLAEEMAIRQTDLESVSIKNKDKSDL